MIGHVELCLFYFFISLPSLPSNTCMHALLCLKMPLYLYEDARSNKAESESESESKTASLARHFDRIRSCNNCGRPLSVLVVRSHDRTIKCDRVIVLSHRKYGQLLGFNVLKVFVLTDIIVQSL